MMKSMELWRSSQIVRRTPSRIQEGLREITALTGRWCCRRAECSCQHRRFAVENFTQFSDVFHSCWFAPIITSPFFRPICAAGCPFSRCSLPRPDLCLCCSSHAFNAVEDGAGINLILAALLRSRFTLTCLPSRSKPRVSLLPPA